MAALFVASYGLWLVYAPEHFMTQVKWATVAIDGRHVPADFYLGNPAHYEAEAFLLAHVPGYGDYMLSFGAEKYREANASEYIHVARTVWTLKPIEAGNLLAPLPFQHENEFRINSHGHLVTIRF